MRSEHDAEARADAAPRAARRRPARWALLLPACLLLLAAGSGAAGTEETVREQALEASPPSRERIGEGGIYEEPGTTGQFEGTLLCVEREVGHPAPTSAGGEAAGCREGFAVLRTPTGTMNLILGDAPARRVSEMLGERVVVMGRYYEDLNAVFVSDIASQAEHGAAEPLTD